MFLLLHFFLNLLIHLSSPYFAEPLLFASGIVNKDPSPGLQVSKDQLVKGYDLYQRLGLYILSLCSSCLQSGGKSERKWELYILLKGVFPLPLLECWRQSQWDTRVLRLISSGSTGVYQHTQLLKYSEKWDPMSQMSGVDFSDLTHREVCETEE